MQPNSNVLSNRQRVINAVTFQPNDYAPHSVSFTQEMHAKMVAYTGNTAYESTINNHVAEIELMEPIVEIRPGFFRDEYGVVWNRTADKDIGVVEDILIPDIEALDDYEFPPVNEAYVRSTLEALAKLGDDKFRVASLGFSTFERAWTLCGMENLLCYMVEEPELLHRLMRKIFDRNMIIVKIAMEHDIDAMIFGDDWGQQQGLIMGPTHWREFIKPYIKELYAYVHKHGKFVAQHSCGDIREILDELIDMGLNIYQTFQPEIYGLDYAKKLIGRMTVWGGISTQADLPCKTPEEIRRVTQETLAAFSRGGLIAAPTHAVPFDVPPENILAMMEVLRNQ